MKSLTKLFSKPGLWMEDAPVPEPGPNEVRVKIRKTAICGTDLHIYSWDDWSQKTIHVPMIIGHEFMGVIDKIGSGVKGYHVGERVSGEGHLTCGFCRNCRAGKKHLCRKTVGVGVNRTGCFAEYLVIPAENAFLIPSTVPDEIAAVFDPLGNACHTALSFDLVGEDVLITGAGPIGLMAVAIARHVGARHIVITDINDYRLEIAKKMGATLALNAQRENLKDAMNDLDMKEGFDVGLEMSGNSQAFESMIEAMNHGSKIASLGIFSQPVLLDWNPVLFKGLIIKGVYGREMYETWYKMTSMLQSGLDISPVITHRLAAHEFEKGFELLKTGKSAKVILEW